MPSRTSEYACAQIKGRITSAVERLVELGAHPRLGSFRRRLDVNVQNCRSVKVSLFKSCSISFVFSSPRCDEAHLDNKYLRYSSSGVAANRSGRLSMSKSLATILHLTLGDSSCHLLTSTHVTFTGFFPVTWLHSEISRTSHTPISS